MPRVLLADDDALRSMLQMAVERDGLEVVAVAGVKDALSRIAEENFDILLSDLHMPHAGDGFTVVSAMHHTHPQALDSRDILDRYKGIYFFLDPLFPAGLERRVHSEQRLRHAVA
jgi:CheY-like chemotaxis protein